MGYYSEAWATETVRQWRTSRPRVGVFIKAGETYYQSLGCENPGEFLGRELVWYCQRSSTSSMWRRIKKAAKDEDAWGRIFDLILSKTERWGQNVLFPVH